MFRSLVFYISISEQVLKSSILLICSPMSLVTYTILLNTFRQLPILSRYIRVERCLIKRQKEGMVHETSGLVDWTMISKYETVPPIFGSE